jgi:hypothetical protein
MMSEPRSTQALLFMIATWERLDTMTRPAAWDQRAAISSTIEGHIRSCDRRTADATAASGLVPNVPTTRAREVKAARQWPCRTQAADRGRRGSSALLEECLLSHSAVGAAATRARRLG